jgi:hypothetical protein
MAHTLPHSESQRNSVHQPKVGPAQLLPLGMAESWGPRAMKIFIWFPIVTLVLISATGWILSELVMRNIKEMGDMPPYFTQLILEPNEWLFIMPVPWLVYASILTRQAALSRNRVLIYVGTWLLFMTLLVCALAVALALPIMPRHS